MEMKQMDSFVCKTVNDETKPKVFNHTLHLFFTLSSVALTRYSSEIDSLKCPDAIRKFN